MNSHFAQSVFASLFPNDEPDNASVNVELYKAMFANDIPNVREILQTESRREFGQYRVPILSLAVISSNPEMVKFLITDMGCKIRQSDEMFLMTPMHWAVSNEFQITQPQIRMSDTSICVGCENGNHHPDLVKLLIENQSNDDAFENIFFDVDVLSIKSPFGRACADGCDESIQIFLNFLSGHKRDIPIVKLITNIRSYFAQAFKTIFGGLIIGNQARLRTRKPEQRVIDSKMSTLRALIENTPHLEQLLMRKALSRPPPMELFLQTIPFGQSNEEFRRLITLLRWIADRGIPLDTVQRDDRSFLEIAVASQNEEFVEMLLRAGCKIRYGSFSTLSVALFRGVQRTNHWRRTERNLRPQRPSIRIIELLLEFGLDLNKEIYLYTCEELPPPSDWSDLVFSHMVHADGAMEDILAALKALRRKNSLVNLKHLCRQSIRNHLKPRADQVIEQLDCVSPAVKRYLLVENESGLLGI